MTPDTTTSGTTMEPAERLGCARAAVGAARAVPGVHDVDGGLTGAFATMGAGERVSGVRVDDRKRHAEIRVVVRYGAELPSLAGTVQEEVAAALEEHGATGPWSVDVRITDLVSDEPPPDEEG